TTIYAVQGQFAGAIPVNTIEEVPQVAEDEAAPPPQGAPGQLSQPRGVAVDADGNSYVADFGHDRIEKFGPGMEFVKEWGEHGDLASQFKQPGDVAVRPRRLGVLAAAGKRAVQGVSARG